MSDVTWQSWPRAEIEETWARWIAANRAAQEKADWSDLADFFHEDASYGWMYSPDDMFMAVGSDQIRELAMGQEMFGFDGWSYPYVVEVIDDQKGLVVASGARSPRCSTPKASTTKWLASAGRGSATAATANGHGSATSSMLAPQRPRCCKWRPTSD